MRSPYLVTEPDIASTPVKQPATRTPYLVATSDITSAPGIETVTQQQAMDLASSQVDCWLVDMQQWQQGWQTICALRSHLSPKVYLRPLVYINCATDLPEEILQAADGHLSGNDSAELKQLLSRLEPINQWIDNLPDADGATDVNLAFKVLRLFASRNQEQAPITTSRRNSGFVFPLLEPLFALRDTGALETLEFLQQQQLLSGRFVSKAHFCSHCDSAFLNFKEACPQCGTDDVSTEELIHHFKCAYVGGISDFRQQDQLVCPKCDQRLHHIGVDYDKPSIIHHCNQCNHQFQEPVTMASCYNCGHTADPENLNTRVIQAYSVTSIGRNAASFGLDAVFTRILETEIRLHSYPEFKTFLQVEMARIARYKQSVSSLVLIELDHIEELHTHLGARTTEMFGELSTAFKAVLRESDVITARNESIFIVVMTETDQSGAVTAVERLQTSIRQLLESNLNFTPEIRASIHNIDSNTEVDKLLEDFLQHHAD